MYNDNNLFFKISFAIIGIWLLTISLGQGWNNAYSQTIETNVIPNAESVFKSQSMTLPSSLPAAAGNAIVMVFISNEAHESLEDERHKLITDHNPYFIPTNLVIPQGTAISFINGDAPWDTPNPHTIYIKDSSGQTVYSTDVLQYTNSSEPKVLEVGKYTMIDSENEFMKGTITVTTDQKPISSSSSSHLIVGGFYTPTNQVENKEDNDGVSHPGWLNYYNEEFPKNGFNILSEYNFHYAICDYCPGGYWPDNKSGDHTLIIYSTDQPFSVAVDKL
ncbi:MAG: cupredoxin domain-containing protein, partial [Thermoproteota archaeon]|nr:cupredoxin domain-containing protein [Thermoproteota archaeon]